MAASTGSHLGAKIPSMAGHIFISYVRDNTDVVKRLAADLTSRGAIVWLDRERLAPGQRWREEIRRAIESCDLFLACFSTEYSDRETSYLNEELTFAIDQLRQRPTDRAWFIPVVLSGTTPDRRISGVETLWDIQRVDLQADWEAGVESIARIAIDKRRDALEDTLSRVVFSTVAVARDETFFAGVVVDWSGTILTTLAMHGAPSERSLIVRKADGFLAETNRVKYDSAHQLGALRISRRRHIPITGPVALSLEKPALGSTVWAISTERNAPFRSVPAIVVDAFESYMIIDLTVQAEEVNVFAGAPIVNDRGELVAMFSGGRLEAPGRYRTLPTEQFHDFVQAAMIEEVDESGAPA
jgi:hypothetical protein